MLTLKSSTNYQEEIKKSRFVVHACRVDTVEKVSEFLCQLSNGKANHNCWAYKIDDQYRFSDDGEPGGTAGKPILAAIEGQLLDHVLVVVTRYFGGIKLGTGGLVRAYGGTASACLQSAEKITVYKKKIVKLKMSFQHTNAVYKAMERFDAGKVCEDYIEDGVILQVTIDEENTDRFKEFIRDVCRNQIQFFE